MAELTTDTPGSASGDEGAAAVQYPLEVEYCEICTMPPEYCEYGPNPSKCYEWMKTNLPDCYTRLVERGVGGLTLADSKRQKRGGKAIRKIVHCETPKQIKVSTVVRGKKKHVTLIVGLKTFGIDLKKASKSFAQHFSCGSSVTGDDEIVIQGDVSDDVIDFIQGKWPEVDDDSISFTGAQKK
ncbi:density-regulated protein homolog [Halichondria panicea]|uniref:density-regulated protein homolog n=1 Tax=Halichondria panicea TaxID=6063 RepID=UPI00312B8795